MELALRPCRLNLFCPCRRCRGTFLVGGVTVDRNEEHCRLKQNENIALSDLNLWRAVADMREARI